VLAAQFSPFCHNRPPGGSRRHRSWTLQHIARRRGRGRRMQAH